MESELPQVRLAACGCVIAASTPPVGYVFRATGTGDSRVLVYACGEHDRTKVLPEGSVGPSPSRRLLRRPPKRTAKAGSVAS